MQYYWLLHHNSRCIQGTHTYVPRTTGHHRHMAPHTQNKILGTRLDMTANGNHSRAFQSRMTANRQAESIKHKTAALFGLELPVVKQPINCQNFHFVQALVAPSGNVHYHGTHLVLGSQLHMHEGYTAPSNVSQMVVWKHCQQPTYLGYCLKICTMLPE